MFYISFHLIYITWRVGVVTYDRSSLSLNTVMLAFCLQSEVVTENDWFKPRIRAHLACL